MINYPSEKWLSTYMSVHACDRETADQAWWDAEIEKGNPTPFDLSEEQEQISKSLRKGRAVDAYGKERKRERKPNADKAWTIQRIALLMEGFADIGEISNVVTDNPERAISYTRNGKRYTLTLTEHRTPKG